MKNGCQRLGTICLMRNTTGKIHTVVKKEMSKL